MNTKVLKPETDRKFIRGEELTVAEIVELGDDWLNDQLSYFHKQILDRHPEFILRRHPFGLKSLTTHRSSVRFLGKDGVTEISVIAMREWLKNNRNFVESLRIIYIEDDDNPRHHLVFFEAAGLYETAMCGGCTDCSGVGGEGNMHLSFMFKCIAQERNISIQKRTVPEYVYEKIRRKLPN